MSDTLDLQTRRAPTPSFSSTWDEDSRTVDVIWAAGAPVKRYDWREGGYFLERLEMTPAAVDLSRLNGGASLLDSHAAYSTHDRVGVVVPGSARVVGGQGVATVQLLRNEGGEALADACRSGAGFLLSVGYSTETAVRDESDGESLPTITATRWCPLEISVVNIPADPAARTRSYERTAQMSRTTSIPDELTEVPEIRSAPRQSAPASRMGAKERREAVERFCANVPAEVRSDLLVDHANTSDHEFRAAMFDAVATQQEAAGIFPHTDRSRGDGIDFIRAAGEGLAARGNPTAEVSAGAREFVGRGLPDLARIVLERGGERTGGMSASQCVARALHASSDFGNVLGHAVAISTRRGYEAAADELRAAARQLTVADFREQKVVDLSNVSSLLKVNEHGEFKRGTVKEGEESFSISTFGRVIGLTRQAIVNDQIGLVTDLPLSLGRKARLFEMAHLAGTLLEPRDLSDGPVFGAERGNLLAAQPLNAEGLSKARRVLRTTRDAAGDFLAIRPRFLIVGPSLETEAEKLLSAISATKSDDVNAFAGKLTILVVPAISDETWFLAGDANEADGLIYAHLSGDAGPVVDTRVGFDVDGIEWKIRLDFGSAFIGAQGWVKATS